MTLSKITRNESKTKKQLIEELTRLRKRITELEKSAAGRRRGKEKIDKQNEFYKNIIDSLPYPFMVIDVKDYTVEITNAAAGGGDLSKGVTCHAISHHRGKPCTSVEHPCSIEIVKETKKPVVVEHIHYNKEGKRINVEVHVYPILDNSGNVSRIIEHSLDISKRVQTKRKLKESETKHRVLFNAIPDMIFRIKRDGTFIDFRPAEGFEPYMPPHEFLGRKIQEVMPKNIAEPAMRLMRQVLSNGEGRSFEYQLTIKDEKHDYEARFVASGEDVVLAIVRDVTERKKAEEQIKKSLKEKEILLKEIHHRVKNNLQIIHSLLSLQAKYLNDEQDKSLFRQTQNRIKTMALIHEKLYTSQDFVNIDFREYIQNLSAHLLRSYSVASRIELRIKVEKITLDIDSAVPCSLVINELVANSIKHAFSNDKKGCITIDFHTNKKDYVLSVQDNGKGLPENLDYRNTESLGLQLVCALAKQLHGKVRLSRSKGTKFTITFKK